MAAVVRSHSSHWGAFEAVVENGELTGVTPYAGDPNPSRLLANIAGTVRHQSRIAQPVIRAGWLERGPGPDNRRGNDAYVPVSWETLTRLLAGELQRVISVHGNEAIYGGSYGWASAGRFQHAQSQLHRFLNTIGGYVPSVNSYSNAAGEVILNRVTGNMRHVLVNRSTDWRHIVEQTELVVAFGGIPLKNGALSPGGQSIHAIERHLRAAAAGGTQFVLFSPLRDDLAAFTNATWHPLVPGTDVAIMLGLAHTLVSEGLHDRAFLARYCNGWERVERYILGLDDGQPKTADWASGLSGIPAESLRDLARQMARKRTLINVSWSLQRADHGEQPPWMGLTLAAMLGQIGLPGGGFGFGYGSMGMVGDGPLKFKVPTFPQGTNPVKTFIPVARIADMLLNPGAHCPYDGHDLVYPEIKLVYWSGGNTFHHHQDLNRLRRAFATVDTLVVHEPFWTPLARHADIVVPTTITLERDDLGAATNDPLLVAMKQVLPPFAHSRNEYEIFADLATAMGYGDAFTEGRTASEWLRHLYETWRRGVAPIAPDLPEFDHFWERGFLELPYIDEGLVSFAEFRADPEGARLPTPSGKIEIYSETIAGFGYADCAGHAAWYEPKEWLGSELATRYPVQLVANNPATRLHSQLDGGATSQGSKISGREPVRIHPADAAARGIRDGDLVRLFNDRGSCLAGAKLSEDVRPGVVQLSTGAWYDPVDPASARSLCAHGNPNVLTFDKGTSSLAQGCAGQLSLVQVERFAGSPPPVRAYDPPAMTEPSAGAYPLSEWRWPRR